jgi:hypothetical protein
MPRGAWPVQRMVAGLGAIAPCIERCVACPRPRQRAGVPYTPGPVPRAARARQKKDCYLRHSPTGTGAHRPPGPRRGGGPYRLDCATFCHFPQKLCKNFPLVRAADIQWPMVGQIAVGMGQGCTVSGHAVRNPATADRISASAVISGHVQWPRGRAEGGGAQKICAKILVLGAVPKCGGAWCSGAIGNSCQSVYALGRDGAA